MENVSISRTFPCYFRERIELAITWLHTLFYISVSFKEVRVLKYTCCQEAQLKTKHALHFTYKEET